MENIIYITKHAKMKVIKHVFLKHNNIKILINIKFHQVGTIICSLKLIIKAEDRERAFFIKFI
jgi:hypothetical protein